MRSLIVVLLLSVSSLILLLKAKAILECDRDGAKKSRLAAAVRTADASIFDDLQ